jgi:hypothetical protein
MMNREAGDAQKFIHSDVVLTRAAAAVFVCDMVTVCRPMTHSLIFHETSLSRE